MVGVASRITLVLDFRIPILARFTDGHVDHPGLVVGVSTRPMVPGTLFSVWRVRAVVN